MTFASVGESGTSDRAEGGRARRSTKSDLAPQIEAALAEMPVHEALAARRIALSITQTELAKRMGVGQSFVARLESGRLKNLTLRTLHCWAAALRTRLTLVISRDDSRGEP